MKTWEQEFEETLDPLILLKNQSGDAYKWARSFMAAFKDKKPDEADMIGWFSNAIMAHHDFLYNTKPLLKISQYVNNVKFIPSVYMSGTEEMNCIISVELESKIRSLIKIE